jgi:hypothetical protein
MKTSSTKTDPRRGFFNVMMALGLLAMLFAPNGPVAAQGENPAVPLYGQLTWENLGAAERAFVLNGEAVTLPGILHQAVEQVNLEDSEDLQAYYSSKSLAGLGWQEVNTTSYPNGVTSVYFHAAGVFSVVEFTGCGDESALTCVSIWQSDPTRLAPVHEPGKGTDADVPRTLNKGTAAYILGTLNKSTPANGASNTNTSLTLTWTAYTGTGLNRYRYCIDKSDNDQCDAVGGWRAVWAGTSADLTSLEYGATYYWQVQAVLSDNTKVDANGGDWWSFTTKTLVLTPPGPFSKNLPANGATGQSITPTLAWGVSTNSTAYEYCIDTTNNSLCDNNWISTTSTSVTIMTGIGADITYYWQARAINAVNLTYSDSGVWSSFKTTTGPSNDTVDTALTAGVPSESNISTTAATIDTGTTNPCSLALGLASVWYKYPATATRRIYIDTFGTSYNTFIAVWTKNANGTLTLVACNDDSSGVTQSKIDLSVNNGTTYYIQVAQLNSGAATVVSPGGSLTFHVRSFVDVLGNSPFWKSIEGIYYAGITGGCATSPNLMYCPSSAVTRASMAVFLLRGIHGASYSPPPVGTSTGFSDVATNYWAAAWIKQLAAEGITSGCGGGNFCPETAVTRAQTAVFLLRSKHGSSYSPPAVGGSTGFADVPADYWAAAWIKQLAAEGITSGCGGGNFCPETAVTRDQMAVFVSRTFSIPGRP